MVFLYLYALYSVKYIHGRDCYKLSGRVLLSLVFFSPPELPHAAVVVVGMCDQGLCQCAGTWGMKIIEL